MVKLSVTSPRLKDMKDMNLITRHCSMTAVCPTFDYLAVNLMGVAIIQAQYF